MTATDRISDRESNPIWIGYIFDDENEAITDGLGVNISIYSDKGYEKIVTDRDGR